LHSISGIELRGMTSILEGKVHSRRTIKAIEKKKGEPKNEGSYLNRTGVNREKRPLGILSRRGKTESISKVSWARGGKKVK